MHVLRVTLPIQQAVYLEEETLYPLGVREIMLDSVESGNTVEVELSVEDGVDDRVVIRYLNSL